MEIAFFRLIKEAKSLTESTLDGITVTFDYENIFNWTCYLLGPENSPYEGLTYELNIEFSDNYPFHHPEIYFITPVFHPNIFTTGYFTITKWSPVIRVKHVLLSIRGLMSISMERSDVIRNEEAADLLRLNPDAFKKKVLEWHKR